MAGRDTWNNWRCCASERDFSETEDKSNVESPE